MSVSRAWLRIGRIGQADVVEPSRRAACIAAAAALCCTCLLLTGCEPLSSAELRREVDSIHSIAAEGSLLADQVEAQRTKRTFARVLARELADAAEHSAERLTDAHPDDGLERQTQAAIQMASEAADTLGQIELAPDDSDAAAEAADRLRRLSARSAQLSGSL
jgi:hypothetical protein